LLVYAISVMCTEISFMPCPILIEPKCNFYATVISTFLISNFRRVLYVVCFLLCNSPASEFYMLKIFLSQTLSHMDTPTILKFSHYLPTCLWRWKRQSVPKRRHIKFRRRGITQRKTYIIISTCLPTDLFENFYFGEYLTINEVT